MDFKGLFQMWFFVIVPKLLPLSSTTCCFLAKWKAYFGTWRLPQRWMEADSLSWSRVKQHSPTHSDIESHTAICTDWPKKHTKLMISFSMFFPAFRCRNISHSSMSEQAHPLLAFDAKYSFFPLPLSPTIIPAYLHENAVDLLCCGLSW